ncbi:hypothetical protein E7Y32_10845 [Arthrobacter sp. UKPF54-2]|uniref:hypothetical protein n=1 Tax=Arthrobacter sp. UKPF54-2 TaxID=2600159 RepID=UPI0011B0F64D|nr:hypothetical protein [Arthrobacter sp. UKPF54-2]QDY90652.1 hypothetical protein E7Y32_10845 [Arthrobacter sp. UKPF54-2]
MKTTGIRTMLLVRLAGLLLWSPGSAGTPGRTHAARAGSVDPRERGDVPGWVMITLMSAVLVAALLALAGPALEGLFNQAMQKVGQ